MVFGKGPAARQRVQRVVRNACLIFALLLTVVIAVPTWILFPRQPTPAPSDAVVVIAGYSDGRHQFGAELVETGVAENFVVSNPGGAKDEVGTEFCRGDKQPDSAVETWCLQPSPVTTVGEALTVGKLAEEQGWSTVTVVTSQFHVRRVSALLRGCSNLDASVMHVDSLQWNEILVRQVLHELGGFVDYWLTNPCAGAKDS